MHDGRDHVILGLFTASGKPEFRLIHLMYLDSLDFILSQLS